eukprot:GFUD01036312.1.p1 GENE.GFUD01036312.1~~GFUD01036312.1.p1  ORF type:complete len:468 (+),score=135.91 GFUD01036312.1:459-1862(+)
MMSRPNRMMYTPITRGHKPTPSQESNTLSTMSEVSCTTTISMESEVTEGCKEEERLEDFTEEEEKGIGWRSGSEETLDTVVMVGAGKGELDKRMKSRNSDYGSYCNSPTDLAGTVVPQDISTDGDTLQNSPLLPTSEEEDNTSDSAKKSDNPLDTVKLEMPPVTQEQEARYQPDKIPGEPLKTLLSALFLGTGFLATTASLAFTHERVPDIKPLPDIVLDNIKHQSWGLDVSEYLLMISTITAMSVVMLHSHRLVILRRIWLLLGILYYYRALTMFVTVLPKPDETYTCMPRRNDTTTLDYAKRVLTIISGGGLSINGKHIYCGDYIFSGHTMTLTMGYLVIKQYSPRHFILLHWASFLTSLCGVIFLLLSRGHYTIDVLLAYYVTSRIWWIYHTLAHNQQLKYRGEHNFLDNMCWWHVFRFFETKIQGPLPRRYSLPLPKVVQRIFCHNITRLRCQNSVSREIFQT